MKNPKIDNHSEILTKLQQAKWIAKIADVDSGNNIYWMTLKGQENYAVICNLLQRHQMYSGPTLSKFFLLENVLAKYKHRIEQKNRKKQENKMKAKV